MSPTRYSRCLISLLASLTAVAVHADPTPPTVTAVSPPPGTSQTNLTRITVTFSEPVTGVTADDLIINGVAATGLTGSNAVYTFTFLLPPYGGVTVTWAQAHGITDLANPPNPFDATAPGANWQYTLIDAVAPAVDNLFPKGGATVRSLSRIEVTFSEDVIGVDAADLLVNGRPATNLIAQPGALYIFEFPQPSAGTVQVGWAAGHNITDLALPPNLFVANSWTYQLNPQGTAGDLVINEILVANTIGLKDPIATPEDPDPLPWIEIYNRDTNTIDLAGWALSDDPGEPGQWVFPAKLIRPGEYLVVFASGLNIRSVTGTNRFHTNFKLSKNGEFLGLYSPDSPRVLVSGFSPQYPEQRNDKSYGYDTQGNLRFFNTATPGAANGNSSIIGVVEPVHFSTPRGHFTQPFDLGLSCPTPGAIIRYTTNGREPTESASQIYFGPLHVTNTTLLRAAAFRTNLLPSRVATHSYFFNLPASIRSLPTVSIVTDQNNLTGPRGVIGISNVVLQADGTYLPQVINGVTNGYHNPSQHGLAWERPVSVEFIRPADNSGFQADAGIRIQGSDYQRPRTTPVSKFSFRLYFRGDYGPGRLNYPLFPLSQAHDFDQVVLRAGFNENGNPFIRDELTRRLSHDQGEVASHGTFAIVFLNGQYFTNSPYYNPCERVHEEFFQSYLGGGEEWDVIEPTFSQTAGANGIVDGDRANFNAMLNYINSQPATSPSVYQQIGRRLDLVNFTDYCLLNAYCAMGDWPANNFRAGKDRSTNGLWRYVVWDGEWAMGIYGRSVSINTFTESGPGPDNSGLNSTANSEIAQIYQRLRASPEYRLLWADRIHKHFFNGGALTDANITNRFGQMRTELLGVIPSMLTDILSTWVPQRRPILFGYFNQFGLAASSNAPFFNQHGGLVPPAFNLTMTATNIGGSIYYATDGRDPRVMFTGAISSNAVLYSGPIALNQSVLIKARTLNGTNWSAVAEAYFQVATLGIPLRITELMYNPTNPALEFLELQNVGTIPVDLSGINFDGITFSFPNGSSLAPGATIVLATSLDPATFAARYPGVAVAGYYAGGLNNGGERISIKDPRGNLILSVDYKDAGGWPAAADGAGYSLEIIDAHGDPDDPANWRASAQPGGSPGMTAPPPPPPSVRLNEVMAENLGLVSNGGTYPDWVELYNAGASSVNLAGWSLSDDGHPRKFVIPPGTTLAADSYLVLWCDDTTNTSPGLHTGFALSRSGDQVYLFDAGTNRVDAVSLGLQLTNYSVGRVGGEWQLTTPTPNQANANAMVAAPASLLINEWLANSAAGQSDWIELHNTASLPVALRGMYLSNTSTVHQITSLSFVPPAGFVQLFADEAVGPDHLDFKLPATGGTIVLYDPTATELDRVSYAGMPEGVARGRLPDASPNFVNFPGTASPGASNYVNSYAGPILNEVLARNQSAVTNAGRMQDFVELFNPGAADFNLGGMTLSVDKADPGQWIFPANTLLPAGGYLVIWCDGSRPASTLAGNFNTGHSLEGESGGVYLFNGSGQLVNSVEYGFQVADRSIGLVGGQWQLLATATPGTANSSAATLANSSALRLNEWMAHPLSGADWFEIYNPASQPVNLAGLILSDDPSGAGQSQFRVAPLSFIAANGFVKWVADGDAGQGRNHVNFSLDAQGESLRLSSTNGTNFVLIDSITFSAQALNVSEGRLPDGQATVVEFPGAATPGESNYLPLPDVVINEVLTHAQTPLEDCVELHNAGPNSVALGGWYLSDTPRDFQKYRIAQGTTISPGGFAVFYQNQFDDGSPASLALSAAHGNELWLSQADASGNLTGYRTKATFGAAADRVSFGRVVTSVGVDYAAMSQHTFGVDTPASLELFRSGTGLPNAAPLVGPVVINELMYHPAEGPITTGDDEYIELHNLTAAPVALSDLAHPTNTWRLSGGVEFVFPMNLTLAADGFLLVVPFDPANAAALASFLSKYSVPPGVAIYGPYRGKLDNGGESVALTRPDAPSPPGAPDAGFVPAVVVDKIEYRDSAPWPAGAVDGGGLSLQRKSGALYGNEPLNWVASLPTPGAANGAGIVPSPAITISPQNQSVFEGDASSLWVEASGAGPLGYQWRFNGTPVPDATNATLVMDYVVLEDEGNYDCLVSNPAGAAVSAAAHLHVVARPVVLIPPVSLSSRLGSNVVFSVLARGSMPLLYQWRLNGAVLPGQTNATLLRTNVQLADDGDYEVFISNSAATAMASAHLTVLISPVIVFPPMNVSVVTGANFTVSVSASGNPLPFGYEWRQLSISLASNVANSTVNFATFHAPTNLVSNQVWRVVVRNQATTGTPAVSQFLVTTLVDSDVDGIPDAWESAFGFNPADASDRNLDSDHDGASNWEEYLAGTDPTNALSFLRVGLQIESGSATLQFQAISNRTYSLQYSDRLPEGPWLKLADVLNRTNNRLETLIDPDWRTNRFYRLLTPQRP